MTFNILFATPLLVFFLVLSAEAKEGFGSTKNIPPVISEQEESVFLVSRGGLDPSTLKITGEDSGIGTAFVVAEDAKYFYFATNNHVIKNACNSNKECSGLRLEQRTKDVISGVVVVPDDKSVSFGKIMLVLNLENPDYAVIKAKKEPNVGYSFKPLQFSKLPVNKGDKVYVIGFPDLSSRICTGRKAIQSQNLIFKRWSEGIFLGYYSYNSTTLMGTTADAAGGNSGGPILNASGEVIGIVSNGPGKCYLGEESLGRAIPHALGLPFFP